MRILFQNRSDALSAWGGDTTQMIETKKHLEALGLQVDVDLGLAPITTAYDVVHVFNLQQSEYALQQVRNAARQGTPVVVSTIVWDTRHVAQRSVWGELARDLSRYIPDIVVTGFPFLRRSRFALRRARFRAAQCMILEAAALLPNSYAEGEYVALHFGCPSARAKTTVVPNGVAMRQTTPLSAAEWKSRWPALPDQFLLEVGRIEPVKGQLAVIEAMMSHPDIPLVFVGKCSDREYDGRCRQMAERRGNVHFVDFVPNELLGNFYCRAKVHALPSLRESPGLATLEAAVHGANCVVSFHGPVAEYFGRDVWYCDPGDVQSLRSALVAAWNAPARRGLRDRVEREFSWAKAAEVTSRVYREVISAK